jgi:DNA-binding response OmpR family regulator
MTYSIIVVTDDIIFPHYFQDLIVKNISNVRVILCDSYVAINEELKKSRCELILLDGFILSLSSSEVIHYIRSSSLSTVPIWLFVDTQPSDCIKSFLEMGVSRVITKPFDNYLICKDVKRLLDAKFFRTN